MICESLVHRNTRPPKASTARLRPDRTGRPDQAPGDRRRAGSETGRRGQHDGAATAVEPYTQGATVKKSAGCCQLSDARPDHDRAVSQYSSLPLVPRPERTHTLGLPRIQQIADRPIGRAERLVHSWNQTKGVAWAATGVTAAAAGSAVPAAIDPAALSASITGMMARLMRMTPPGRPYRSATCCVPHLTRRRR